MSALTICNQRDLNCRQSSAIQCAVIAATTLTKHYRYTGSDSRYRERQHNNVRHVRIYPIEKEMKDCATETVEGQQEISRIAAARDQSGKDICQIRNVKSATGEVLMKDDERKERWALTC